MCFIKMTHLSSFIVEILKIILLVKLLIIYFLKVISQLHYVLPITIINKIFNSSTKIFESLLVHVLIKSNSLLYTSLFFKFIIINPLNKRNVKLSIGFCNTLKMFV